MLEELILVALIDELLDNDIIWVGLCESVDNCVHEGDERAVSLPDHIPMGGETFPKSLVPDTCDAL